MADVIKFPDETRFVRGRAEVPAESATIIILPVIRIERYADPRSEDLEPNRRPPAENGGKRRIRRR